MEYIPYPDLANKAREYGRTFFDQENGILYMNWTCTGIEFLFRGTCLLADFTAVPGEEVDALPTAPDGRGQFLKRPTWPWVAIFLDGEEVPRRRFEVKGENATELLFHSRKSEVHRIRLVKLTENIKSYLGLLGLWAEGSIEALPEEKPVKRIEFLGDSITCGFGNEARDANRLFFSADENGWLSYAALAGRMMGMDYSLVCSSGICSATRPSLPHPYSINRLYPYTDRALQEQRQVGGELLEHPFSSRPNDYVVINLGTNDATAIFLSDDPKKEEEAFLKDYIGFLKLIREKNGPKTQIICSLGSMCYYLWSTIQEAVKAYQEETGDEAVHLFRFPKIDVREPLGACGHPYITTHERMARELVLWMKETFGEEA